MQIEIIARGGTATFREYDRLLIDGKSKPAPEVEPGDVVAGLGRVVAVRELVPGSAMNRQRAV